MTSKMADNLLILSYRKTIGNRIVTALAERIATNDAPQSQHRSLKEAVLFISLYGVTGTSGSKTTVGADQRRQKLLINAN